jgi:hypothetical protein
MTKTKRESQTEIGSLDQDYEVRYLAEEYGLSHEQARELVARIGNDRQKLEEAAKGLAASL